MDGPGWSQEPGTRLGLPRAWQGSKHLSHQLLPPGAFISRVLDWKWWWDYISSTLIGSMCVPSSNLSHCATTHTIRSAFLEQIAKLQAITAVTWSVMPRWVRHLAVAHQAISLLCFTLWSIRVAFLQHWGGNWVSSGSNCCPSHELSFVQISSATFKCVASQLFHFQPCSWPRKAAAGGPSVWLSATHMGGPHGFPGSWLELSAAPIIVAIWGMKKWKVEGCFLSVSPSLSL